MKTEKKTAKEFVDRLGNVLVVGDYIVYANAAGRCSKTALGKIEAIYIVRDYRLNEAPQLRVLSIQDDTPGVFCFPYAKSVTLSETSRVIAYAARLLSKEMRAIFDAGDLKESWSERIDRRRGSTN